MPKLGYGVFEVQGVVDDVFSDYCRRRTRSDMGSGTPLPLVARLLGRKRPSMTLRYAHLSWYETEVAAEPLSGR